ncbi:MAG: acetoacetate decarboxylase family protein [Alphaproteobacteria bacterium]|nr:acetoacetate decarboxylase family protein [Alphaproteobacteria bacterium]
MKTTRRDLMLSGLAGALASGALTRARADDAFIEEVEKRHYDAKYGKDFYREVVSVRYLTDPDRIARAIPGPLTPDDVPEVIINFVVTSRLLQGKPGVMYPGPNYNESDTFIGCKYKGNSAILELELQLEHDYGRSAGRENDGLRKKDGKVRIDRYGDLVRCSTTRRGKLQFAVEGRIKRANADPRLWFREVGYGWLGFFYRIDPDWTRGLVHPDTDVALWRKYGWDEGYPTGHGEIVNGPLMLDPSSIRVYVNEEDPLNPLSEFPVRSIVGGSYQTGEQARIAYATLLRAGKPATEWTQHQGISFLETVDKASFEPFALRMQGYDTPITASKPWVPQGWPAAGTAWKLTQDQMKRWRERPALDLTLDSLVDIEFELPQAAHARVVPPPCKPGSRPRGRILALDLGANDLSTAPSVELWLLASCEGPAGPAWTAVSHIVGWDGDILFGRETFGYPSKFGHPEMVFDGAQYNIRGRRLLRDFFHGVVPVSFDPPTAHEDAFSVLGIQLLSWNEPPRADLIAQPWEIALSEMRTADPGQVRLFFPREPGPGNIGLSDPWFELEPSKILSVRTGKGMMKRKPGRALAVMPNFLPWFLDRYDGGSNVAARGSFVVERSEYWEKRFGPGWTIPR